MNLKSIMVLPLSSIGFRKINRWEGFAVNAAKPFLMFKNGLQSMASVVWMAEADMDPHMFLLPLSHNNVIFMS